MKHAAKSGHHTLGIFTLPEDKDVILGASAKAECSVAGEPFLSRFHLVLRASGGKLRAERLPDARNPVFFRGSPSDRFDISPGDFFVIGATLFHVYADQDTADSQAVSAQPETAPTYEKVTLSKPVDLRRVAEWAETTIDEIQALNPELRRWTTPVRDAQYELRVPAGTADQVSTRLADAAAVELASLNWYTAKRGDTLALIAKKLKVSKNDLAEANYLSTKARVTTGQKLMVPREATVLMAARSTPEEQTAKVEKPEKTPAVAEARRTVPETGGLAPSAGPNRVKAIYAVKRGDTLASIARLFKTTVAALQNWNPRIPGDRIEAGQRLTAYRIAS